MVSFLQMHAQVAEVGQLALDTLEPVAALASLRLALGNPHELDVVTVLLAHTTDDALIGERLNDVRIGFAAHRLALDRLHVVRIVVAFRFHGDLESLGTVQNVPRVRQVFKIIINNN